MSKAIKYTDPRKHLASALLSYYEPIPEEQWCTSALTDNKGRYCALGHLIGHQVVEGVWYGCRAYSQANVFGLSRVNDDDDPRYKQATPKARVITYLCDVLEGKHEL